MVITERQYLLRSWPAVERRIKTAADVAAETAWPIALCQQLHERLYRGFALEPDGKKLRLKPDIERSKFLRLRKKM